MARELGFTLLLLLGSFLFSGFGLLLPYTIPLSALIYGIEWFRFKPAWRGIKELTLFAFLLASVNVIFAACGLLWAVFILILPAARPPFRPEALIAPLALLGAFLAFRYSTRVLRRLRAG